MDLPLQLVSTDFDGTIYAEGARPPIAGDFAQMMARLQAAGMIWVINTGRDLDSLQAGLSAAALPVQPDYAVTVERELYRREGSQFVGLRDWNEACARDHQVLFETVRPDVPRLVNWVSERFPATIYQDAFSPFCLIAEDNHDADQVQEFLLSYCRTVPGLTVVRNDVYARFSHVSYNKGTALTYLAGRLGFGAERVFVAGDHLNDLPMLTREVARWVACPSNAVAVVRDWVLAQRGYVSQQPCGLGVARALEWALEDAGLPWSRLNPQG